MEIKNIIKKTVLEGFNTDINTTKIVITLGITILIGIYIFYVYKYKSKSCFYSKDFNVVLAVISVITAGIVLAMQSRIVISLGMVGAFSIIRFRNAVKSQMDLLFLFWSISIGIIVVAGMYEIGIVLSVCVTILLFVLDFVPVKNESLLLISNLNNIEVEPKIIEILKENKTLFTLKSKNINKRVSDYIFEIRSNHKRITKNRRYS